MEKETGEKKLMFDIPGNSLVSKSETSAEAHARRAKEWAGAMSQPDANWWTKLSHELPLDWSEGSFFGADPAEDRRNALLEQYKSAQSQNKELTGDVKTRWEDLLLNGKY